eukprot:jgi/Mesen1/3774/ME000205S03040
MGIGLTGQGGAVMEKQAHPRGQLLDHILGQVMRCKGGLTAQGAGFRLIEVQGLETLQQNHKKSATRGAMDQNQRPGESQAWDDLGVIRPPSDGASDPPGSSSGFSRGPGEHSVAPGGDAPAAAAGGEWSKPPSETPPWRAPREKASDTSNLPPWERKDFFESPLPKWGTPGGIPGEDVPVRRRRFDDGPAGRSAKGGAFDEGGRAGGVDFSLLDRRSDQGGSTWKTPIGNRPKDRDVEFDPRGAFAGEIDQGPRVPREVLSSDNDRWSAVIGAQPRRGRDREPYDSPRPSGVAGPGEGAGFKADRGFRRDPGLRDDWGGGRGGAGAGGDTGWMDSASSSSSSTSSGRDGSEGPRERWQPRAPPGGDGYARSAPPGYSRGSTSGYHRDNVRRDPRGPPGASSGGGYSRERPSGSSRERPGGYSWESSDGLSRERPGGYSGGTPGGSSRDSPGGYSRGAPGGGFSREDGNGSFRGSRAGSYRDGPGGTGGGASGGYSRERPGGYSRAPPGGSSKEGPGGYVRAHPGGRSRQNPDGFTRALPSGFSRSGPSGTRGPPGFVRERPGVYSKPGADKYSRNAPSGDRRGQDSYDRGSGSYGAGRPSSWERPVMPRVPLSAAERELPKWQVKVKRKRDKARRAWLVGEIGVMRPTPLVRLLNAQRTWMGADDVHALVNLLLAADHGPRAFRVLKWARQMDWYEPSFDTYTKLAADMCRLDKLSRAVEAYDMMITHGMVPTAETYEALVRAHLKHGDAEELRSAHRYYCKMKQFAGYKPSLDVQQALFEVLSSEKAGKSFQRPCEELLLDMQASGFQGTGVMYARLCAGAAKRGDIAKVDSLLGEMQAAEISAPPTIYYNVMLACKQAALSLNPPGTLGNAIEEARGGQETQGGDLEGGKYVWRKGKSAGGKPSRGSLVINRRRAGASASASGNHSDEDASEDESALDSDGEGGSKGERGTGSDGEMARGREGGGEEGPEEAQEEEKVLKERAAAELVDRAERGLRELEERQVARPRHVFLDLMQTLERAGQPEKVEGVWQQMVQAGARPDVSCYTVMAQALCQLGEREKLERLVQELYVKLGLLEELEACFRQMEASGSPANATSYNRLLEGRVCGGQLDGAREVYDTMRAPGGAGADDLTFNLMLDAYGQLGRKEGVREIYNHTLEARRRVQLADDVRSITERVVGTTRVASDEKSRLKLTKQQRETVIGVLLGGGRVESHDFDRTYEIHFEQDQESERRTRVLRHLFELFQPWAQNTPAILPQAEPDGSVRHMLHFATVSHKSFRFYAHQWCPQGTGVIPRLVHRWLSPRALAYWYMYGGFRCPSTGGIILNAKEYSTKEVQLVVHALKARAMDCQHKRRKRENVIRFTDKSATWLWKLMEPYILPEVLDDLKPLEEGDPRRRSRAHAHGHGKKLGSEDDEEDEDEGEDYVDSSEEGEGEEEGDGAEGEDESEGEDGDSDDDRPAASGVSIEPDVDLVRTKA